MIPAKDGIAIMGSQNHGAHDDNFGIDGIEALSVSEYENNDSSSQNDGTSASGSKGSVKYEMKRQQDAEVMAIHEKTQKENVQVNTWRLRVTFILLATAVAITIATYHFLAMEEYSNFETAYEQFARTVGDAAVSQQIHFRKSIAALSHAIS